MRIANALLSLAMDMEGAGGAGTTAAALPDVLCSVSSSVLASVLGPGSGIGTAVEATRWMIAGAVLDLLQEQIDVLRNKSRVLSLAEIEAFPSDEDEGLRLWAAREASWEVGALARGMGSAGRDDPIQSATHIFWGRLLCDIFRAGVRAGIDGRKVAAAVFVLLADIEDQLDESTRSLEQHTGASIQELVGGGSAAATAAAAAIEDCQITQAVSTILKRETVQIKDRVRRISRGEEEDVDTGLEMGVEMEQRAETEDRYHDYEYGYASRSTGRPALPSSVAEPLTARPKGSTNPALAYADDIDLEGEASSEQAAERREREVDKKGGAEKEEKEKMDEEHAADQDDIRSFL